MEDEKPKFIASDFIIPRQGGRAFPTADLLRKGITEYFEVEKQRGVPPMLMALQEYLEISDAIWYEYAKGKRDYENNNYSEICDFAMKHIVANKAQGAYVGAYNAAFAKFDLSANHDWIEKKAVDVTTSGSSKLEVKHEPVTAEDALRIYQEAMKKAVLDEKDENQ